MAHGILQIQQSAGFLSMGGKRRPSQNIANFYHHTMNIIFTYADSTATPKVITVTTRLVLIVVAVIVVLFAFLVYFAAQKVTAHWFNIKSPIVTEIVQEQQRIANAERLQLWEENIGILQEEIALLRANAWLLNRQGEVLATRLGLPGSKIFDEEAMCPANENSKDVSAKTVAAAVTSDIINTASSLNKLQKKYALLEDKTAAAAVLKDTIPMERPIIGHNWRTSLYGYRKDPFTGRRNFHSGYDYSARLGTPVIAAATGIVTYRGRLGNYGNAVQLLHGQGVSTLYGHLSKIDVDRWQYVNRGETIGAVWAAPVAPPVHIYITNCA